MNEIGIQDIESSKYGYFIVKYDFSNADVEVINTNGYDGKYTLTQIVEEIEGIEDKEESENIQDNQETQEVENAQS